MFFIIPGKEEWPITVKELEIIVTLKVEKALSEVMKLAPEINKQIQQVQRSFSRIDMKSFNKKIQQSLTLVKKQVSYLKNSSKSNQIKLTVNNKQAQEQISQLKKQIGSLQQKTRARKVNKWNNERNK